MPTERQLDIILESELEFKTFKEEPMNNKQLPAETQDRIKADAGKYACLPSKHTDKIDRLEIGKYIGYIKGATVYNGRSNILLDALEAVYRLKDLWLCSGEVAPEHEGEAQALSEMALQVERAIEQWKGTGKEETKPEPEGCPYCGSVTCTSDHK